MPVSSSFFILKRRAERQFACALWLVFCVLIAGQARANPTMNEYWSTYPVDGVTARQILNQMGQRGPNGFWAYTSWYVRWTGDCKVSLEISYTMPKHINEAALPADLRARWTAMVAALAAHERKHGQHGVNAANEVFANGCRNGVAITNKWAEQDRALDRRTNHGASEGVVFP